MAIDPALWCTVKFRGESFLLACKYSKDAFSRAIISDEFTDDELEEIGKQIAKANKMRQLEDMQRRRRFDQYINDIRESIFQKYEDMVEDISGAG
jgi:hypothetical protein